MTLWVLAEDGATAENGRTAMLGIPIFALLAIGSFNEQRVALAVDAHGIGGTTAFRGRRRVAWADVVEVRWATTNQWFVLVDRHGEKVRVSRLLQGHDVVPAMLRAHVPEPVWRDAVKAWERAMRTT